MRSLAALVTGLAVAAQPALGHTPIPGVTGFSGGLLHPLLAPAHALALIALGLLLGQQPPAMRRILLALFAAALAAGIAAIVAAFAAYQAELVVLAAAAAAGALTALARPLPLGALIPLPLALGIALEFDSVPQDISMQATFLAIAGSAVAAFVIVLLAVEASSVMRREWERIGVRVLGSWAAASAILVLALRLAA